MPSLPQCIRVLEQETGLEPATLCLGSEGSSGTRGAPNGGCANAIVVEDRGFLACLRAICKTVRGGPFACSVAIATRPGSQS